MGNRPKQEMVKTAGALPLWKKLLFATIIVCVILGLAELLLTMLGVTPVSYEKDPYVGFSSYVPLFQKQQTPDGTIEMVTADNKLVWFNSQRFDLKKNPKTYRIFCVGGSTTYGRPYTDLTSFCGWLRAMLPKADPSREWEVINAGGISYASYRVATLMEELVKYQPDLFIIYSGHNEFLENRTYDQIIRMPETLRGFGAIASKTRTYAALKHIIDQFEDKATSASNGNSDLPGEVVTILEKTVGTEAYHRDLENQSQIFEHYRYNLIRMIDIAQSANAKVILVKPASKLRECSPFKSEHRDGLTDPDLQKWQTLFDSANSAYASGQLNEALQAIDKALTIDDQYSDLVYLQGRVLWQLERYDEAKKTFIKARDEDICPLRALTPMEEIVCEVATQKTVPWVDFVAMTEKHSTHATPGDDVFLDHVHPTIESNRLLALELLETMKSQDIVHPAQTWDEAAIQDVCKNIESHLSPEAHAMALANLAQLYAWCAKFEDGYRLAQQAIEMAPMVAPAYLQAAVNAGNLGKMEESAEYYQHYLQLEPDAVEIQDRVGRLLVSQGKMDEAIEHYQKALQVNPAYAEAHNNLAIALQTKGNLNEAMDHYRQALQINPAYPSAHNNLATVLKMMGRIDEAALHYSEAIKADPDFFESHYNLALILMGQGRFDEALQHFQQVRRIKGDWPDVLVVIAYALAVHPDEQKRDAKQAIQLAEQAVAMDNNQNIQFLNILAIAYAADGQFDRAVTTTQKVLTLATAANDARQIQTVEKRLELYKQGKPYLPFSSK